MYHATEKTSTAASGLAGGKTSLASIYQARKSGHGDPAVHVLKKQFQTHIERIVQEKGHVPKSYIPSSNEREVREFKKLNREKSFDEARTAVQSQIERIFQKAAAKKRLQDYDANSAPKARKDDKSHGSGAVPVVSPLPVGHQGITLQTLMEKKRSLDTHHETIAEVTEVSSASSSGGKQEPFRIHGGAMSRISTLSRHFSMDNLAENILVGNNTKLAGTIQRAQEQKTSTSRISPGHNLAKGSKQNKKFTSMTNLNATPARLSSSKYNSLKPTPAKPGSKSQDKTKAASSTLQQQHSKTKVSSALRQTTEKKPLAAAALSRKNAPNPRDANLHHLGRMSPEEQLNKFLQSVEREKEKEAKKPTTQPGLFHKNRAAKRDSAAAPAAHAGAHTGASRWHSMDNLTMAAAKSKKQDTTAAEAQQPPRRPQRHKKELTPSPPSGKASSGSKVGFKEINGPKSFSSMSQLDSLAHTKTSEVMRQSGSSTEDSNGNKKPKNKAGRSRGAAGKEPPLHHPEDNNAITSLDETSHRTKVTYLGCLPITDQSSDMSSLQLPLKDLYFRYLEIGGASLSASSLLEITGTGLKVQYYRDRHRGVLQEIFNPFPSIAVWAAVRFVYKREDATSKFVFAFLPLVTEPGDSEKTGLFNPLPKRDLKTAVSSEHAALFTCIMRKVNAPKTLECHGFVCQSKDEAMKIAAKLYKSLMETMKKEQQTTSISPNASKESKSLSPSVGGLSHEVSSMASTATPSRPPRKKKRAIKGSSEEASADQMAGKHVARAKVQRSHSEKMYDSETEVEQGQETSHLRRTRFRRSASERRSDGELSTIGKKKGDIYTKVAMPRSKSFMNVSGQYNLQELFKELRDKEGIESIDDILRHVITKDGMSFNKISPVYRELLMKLAMSMSKDEMFIRSKNIMNQEKVGAKKSESTISRVLGVFGVNKHKSQNNASKASKAAGLSKADIGGPTPVSEEQHRELSKKWQLSHLTPVIEPPSSDQLTLLMHQQHLSNATLNQQELRKQQRASGASSKGPSSKGTGSSLTSGETSSSSKREKLALPPATTTDGESCISCSECNVGGGQSVSGADGYQSLSICADSQCSCSAPGRSKRMMTGNRPAKPGGAGSAGDKSSSPSSSTSSSAASSSRKAGNRKGELQPADSSTPLARQQQQQQQQHQVVVARVNRRPELEPAAQRGPPRRPPSEATSCSTCYCHYCGAQSRDDGDTTTCYSCSSTYGTATEESDAHHHGRRKHSRGGTPTEESDSNSSLESGSASVLSSIESPQTAWNRRHNSINNNHSKNASHISETTEDEAGDGQRVNDNSSDDDDDTSNTSVLSVVHKNNNNLLKIHLSKAHEQESNIAIKASSTTMTPEHVDGFFRNISLNSEGVSSASTSSSKSSSRQQKSSISMDSLSSEEESSDCSSTLSEEDSSSSLSADSVQGEHRRRKKTHRRTRKKKRGALRPAYSEANMHNSLGYLP